MDDELDEIAANVTVLIAEEMEVQHRLGTHPAPAVDCALCRSHAGPGAAPTLSPGGGRP